MEAFERISIERIDDVTIVRPVDERLIEDRTIQELGKELHSLVWRGGHKDIILDMSGVHFMSSASLGKLITMDKITRAAGGSFSLCGVHEGVQECFAMTRLDRLFPFYPDRETAMQGVRRTEAGVACPFEDCRGLAKPLSRVARKFKREWLACPECGCVFAVESRRVLHGEDAVVGVKLTAHSGTTACLLPASKQISHGLRGPYVLQVEGVLDVSAADAMERLREVLPPPRWVMLDLRSVSEQTELGLQGAVHVVSAHEADHWCALVAPSDREKAHAFEGVVPVFRDFQQALQVVESVCKSPPNLPAVAAREQTPNQEPAQQSGSRGCLVAIILLVAGLCTFVLSGIGM